MPAAGTLKTWARLGGAKLIGCRGKSQGSASAGRIAILANPAPCGSRCRKTRRSEDRTAKSGAHRCVRRARSSMGPFAPVRPSQGARMATVDPGRGRRQGKGMDDSWRDTELEIYWGG